jgi:hypothetical protein
VGIGASAIITDMDQPPGGAVGDAPVPRPQPVPDEVRAASRAAESAS